MAIQDKKDLAEKASLALDTTAKMGRAEFVSTEILYRIGKKLNVDFADMVSIVNGEESE